MLGKRPRPLLQSSLLVGDKCNTRTANAQVSDKLAHPSSSVPQHVVLGFHVEQEIKRYDGCESPRSVLDVNALPSEKQTTVRSLRSCLRTLPLPKKGSQGVGLAIIVDIQAEEDESNGLLPRAGDNPVCPDRPSSLLQRSQPVAIVANPCVDVHLSAKKDDPVLPASHGHHQHKLSDSEDNFLDLLGLGDLSPWQDCVLHNQPSREAEVDEDYVIPPPIFSVASLPSSPYSFNIGSMSFLDACAFCQRAFLPGKDIYMYRGDQAFCSADCRTKQIQIDERKEKQAVMASSPDHRTLLKFTCMISHKSGKV